MRRAARVLSSFVSLSLFLGCSSDGSEPPSVGLLADPEVCSVPCEVVFDSGVEPSEGSSLTFAWDFGEGAVEGDARVLHRWEAAGSYTVSVTVSDGQSSVTDTATVIAEEQPKASAVIDEAGGTVLQGNCAITIPEGVAPEPFTLELTELRSMDIPAERAIGPGELVPLGSAYDVDMPLKSSDPLPFTVTDPEAEGVDPSELAWLVRMIVHPVPPANQPDFVGSPGPLADYVLVPVTGVDDDGTAHGEIYGRKRFQLVRLNEPLHVEVLELEGDTAQKALPALSPIVIFKRNPSRITITDFKNAVVEGLNESRKRLIDSGGFKGPGGAVVVYVGKLENPKWDAFVPFFDRHTIHISYTLTSQDHVKKAIAHEFFHLIQNHHSNRISSWNHHHADAWFNEGTATWAMDEVFDGIQGHYFAPSWTRFNTPFLEKLTSAKFLHAYQNVAFWKWAEASPNNATIIRRMLEDHYANTHSTLVGYRNPVENFANVDYLLSLKKLWGNADFLDFTYKARYLKDFDTQETRAGELWSSGSNELGRPKEISFANGTAVSAIAGGTADNPAPIDYELKPHLTAEVIQVTSIDLEGTLHVRFVSPTAPLDAKLIVVDKAGYDVQASDEVRDITTNTRDLTAKLSPDEHAYIFLVDPRWNHATTTTSIKGKINAWVEDPCGSVPANVVEITPDDDLFVALTSAPAGSAVRLGPGTYSPPLMQWPTPEFGPFGANVLVKDLTLIGAGEGQTTIVMTGDEYGGIGLKTYGNATVRNLTIEGRQAEPIVDCLDAKQVTFCNVTMEASANTDFGIIWGPWNGGSTSLSLYDSTLVHPNREQLATGIMLQSCYETPATVSATISHTNVSGWLEGVVYYTGEGQCGSVSVSADCEGFSNNEYNVVESNCSGGVCTYNEQCPAP